MELVSSKSPVLREKTAPADISDPATKKAIAKMVALLKKTTGIGLAAPQVGLNISVFITDLPNNPAKTPYVRINGKSASLSQCRPMAFINPQIEVFGADTMEKEGCLSLPEIGHVPVPRKEQVVVTFLSAEGKPTRLETSGLFARAIQHEFDHLQGVLITDYQEQTAPAPEPVWNGADWETKPEQSKLTTEQAGPKRNP